MLDLCVGDERPGFARRGPGGTFPIVAWSRAAPVAYVSGSLGTLIGADLMNFPAIRSLGTPVASIGGAGTFDGIFVTGIVAVVLASILGAISARRAHPDPA